MAASWQSFWIERLVRARMRPHALRPIDPQWVRTNMGRPRVARRLMARATGARFALLPPQGSWVGGERLQSTMFSAAVSPTVLYLHGGGYIGCSPETHRSLAGALAQRIGGEVYVPAYRLAPEHRFPDALDDALGAYRHVLDLGVAPDQMVVAGDSAGGGLALSMLLAARDRGWPLPAAVVTYSPWTDLAATGASLEENSDRCAMFAAITIRRAAAFYVGDADPRSPYVSPLYGDFRGFPPMLVHASTDEVLRDDSVRLVERARAAGVPVELRMWPRVPHVWQFFSAVLPEARESLADTQRFVLDHLAARSARVDVPSTPRPR
ncbi:MAG TPA: alpha/beta hydrolase [Gemmatimonas sp.]|uniref:alpha/beta hydrolase n=1 Tax=Gemmatimonas sp. TaxID=1962908 RepID=UPI002ED95F96